MFNLRHFLTVVLLGGLAWLAWKFQGYAKRQMAETKPPVEGAPAPGKLPGLAADLEPSLDAAKRQGAEGLSKWLRQYRPQVQEPRLTDLELDYVVLVGRENPAEARRVLGLIRRRITPASPAYPRFEKLEQAYR